MKNNLRVGIIGAGPAGLAAAVSAVTAGADVVVIDANTQPGGQYFRHLSESTGVEDHGDLHHAWNHYLKLRTAFDRAIAASTIRYVPYTQVVMCEVIDEGTQSRDSKQFKLRLAPTTTARYNEFAVDQITVDRVVVATGSFDRHIPIPGWDLPGVMAAGGIQAMIKANGVLPGQRFLLAGTGPFLLPVASNILAAGGKVVAVCESASLSRWIPYTPRAVLVPGKLFEGATYLQDFLRHKVKFLQRTMITKIHAGNGEVSGVSVTTISNDRGVHAKTNRYFEVDSVGLGFGFTPQMELLRGLNVNTTIDTDDNVVTKVNRYQATSVRGIWAAGEVTGVGGSTLAVAEGHIAGTAAGTPSGVPHHKAIRKHLRTVVRHRVFAQAMHNVHRVPNTWQDVLCDDTVVCRCEEVTASEIQHAVSELGATNQRAVKLVTRAGMGWCQGRMCGFATSCLSRTPESQPPKRPLSIPIELQALADMTEVQQP